ncbi:C40 family peptidase [Acidocella aromatica]|uniref:Lipo-like protein n=1 Tax=Acidocella aromatica TaxID=1303579 RepID=A0A840VCB0_9PROT|nr:lipo-like protein [Acidocella aromatica]MBB5373284.1 hypothetical protein [Acidocella aromatica]
MNRLRRFIGGAIARFLTKRVPVEPALPVNLHTLRHVLRPADVILVEGHLRISTVIKYLTQSTWSHAALYAGGGECIEADIIEGVRSFKLDELVPYHVRICRPINLTDEDADKIIAHAVSRLGGQYDLKHVFDLARYMVPLPVPRAWRRRAIALGSADPTRAICSTLVAECFQMVGYPILPEIPGPSTVPAVARKAAEVFHIYNTGLFTPRDFDLSPFFYVIKPDTPQSFDYHRLVWID